MMSDEALARLGAVDFMVNAAGVTGATGDFHTIGDEGWIETLDILLMGTVRVARLRAGHGRAQGRSHRPVRVGGRRAALRRRAALCAAKAGILTLAEGLSKTYSKYGVLVNSVSSASIATPMTDAMMEKRAKENGTNFGEAIESFLKEERPTLKLQRRERPEKAAAVVVFLCSKNASFVNGAIYRVDGGSVATV